MFCFKFVFTRQTHEVETSYKYRQLNLPSKRKLYLHNKTLNAELMCKHFIYISFLIYLNC